MNPVGGLPEPAGNLVTKCGNRYFISVVPEKANGLTLLLLSSITPNVKLDVRKLESPISCKVYSITTNSLSISRVISRVIRTDVILGNWSQYNYILAGFLLFTFVTIVIHVQSFQLK